MQQIFIAPARETDVQVASEIMTEAYDWLEEKGTPLWRREELTARNLMPFILKGELHIVWIDATPAGTVILQWEDDTYWPDAMHGEAVYLHKLAIRRAYSGQNIIFRIIDWSRQKAGNMGRAYLRLDCEAQRDRLRAYYETAGFKLHSEIPVQDRIYARYQMSLTQC